MRESQLEKQCRALALAKGGWLLKWTGENGVPDRILLLPNRVVFMEFKTTTGRLSPAQLIWGERLIRLGLSWTVIRSVDEFKAWLQ